MPPNKILDTHIHLWPSTSVSPTNHVWMTPGHDLAKRHGISDYSAAAEDAHVAGRSLGFIYVETDRYLAGPLPDVSGRDDEAIVQLVQTWAHEPLEELKFLRRIVEGSPHDGDGCAAADGSKMIGCVIWAPFHLPPNVFDIYLRIAEGVSGPDLWKRVVGFRYLLQGIKDETEFRTLTDSQSWLANVLRLRSGRTGEGWAFDVGVDTHNGGIWQLEAAADMVNRVRELEAHGEQGSVRFILNHLCKPDLSTTHWPSFPRWQQALTRLAAHSGVFMKFSGAFNEFAPAPTPAAIPSLVRSLTPFVQHVFQAFGSSRVMFGSDWPVCNVGGPAGHGNWGLWSQVVEESLRDRAGVVREDVWWRAGSQGYRVEF